MKRLVPVLLLISAILSCKSKHKYDSTKAYFPVVNFIQSQIKEIDSTARQFSKITTRDSLSDTVSISKDEFKNLAKDFLSLPDISSDRNMDDYDETSSYDELLNNLLLTYTPKNDKAEIRNETIML